MPAPIRTKSVSLTQNGTVKSILRGTLGPGSSTVNDYAQSSNTWTNTNGVGSVATDITSPWANWCRFAFQTGAMSNLKSASPISTVTTIFSFAFRFKMTTTPAADLKSVIFINGDFNNLDGYAIVVDEFNTLYFYEVNKGSQANISTISTGTWYDVAVTVDNTGRLRTYLNGSTSGSGLENANITAPSGQTYFFTVDGTQYYFDGMLTDFFFMEKVLNDTEILNLYTAVLH